MGKIQIFTDFVRAVTRNRDTTWYSEYLTKLSFMSKEASEAHKTEKSSIFMPRGGASAYCNCAVCLSVSPSFTSISRRSLKTNSLAVESKKRSNVELIGIVTILVSKYVKCFTL